MSVRCWGLNAEGQLGIESFDAVGDDANEMGSGMSSADLGAGARVLTLSSGASFVCALLRSKAIKCWGRNQEGQLGIGSDDASVGGRSDEMGDSLRSVGLGSNVTALQVSAGFAHACAVTGSRQLKCWGDNVYGQLGLGDIQQRGGSAGTVGDNLDYVDLGVGQNVTAVSTGRYHTCAILQNYTVKCWGYNDFGTLGVGDTLGRGDDGPGLM